MDKIDFINAQAPALNDENLNKMQDNIERAINAQVSGDTLPIGTVLPYTNETAPENWLVCDGSELDRTEYNHLFAIIGTTFGEGDGSTTFNLPNLKGKILVGFDATDTDFNKIAKTGGKKTHTHTYSHQYSGGYAKLIAGSKYTSGGNGEQDAVSTAKSTTDSSSNLQPYVVTNYIIKAKQSAGIVATVIDNLISTSATDVLSAKQGKVLNERIIKNSTYLAEEQAVGTWIDGKTIYRKVINFGALPNATKKEVQHNISNISIFTKIEGIAIRNDETKFTQSLPLVYKNAEMFYNTALAVDNTIIEIQTAGDRSMFNGYVTLEYTKTVED